jgi:hypothetical protein
MGFFLTRTVKFVVNGEEKFKEEYTDPKANVVLDSAISRPTVGYRQAG